MTHKTDCLDLRHLKCPLPFVQLHRHMRKLSAQEGAEVLVAVGATSEEMGAWAEKMGYRAALLEKNETDCRFYLQQSPNSQHLGT